MTLLWVTEHFVMQKLTETVKINVSVWKLRSKPLQIGELKSNNDIMQFHYFYWKTNEKKADEKETLILDEICHDCNIA